MAKAPKFDSLVRASVVIETESRTYEFNLTDIDSRSDAMVDIHHIFDPDDLKGHEIKASNLTFEFDYVSFDGSITQKELEE